MSLQVNIKNSSGSQVVTSLTGLNSVKLDTKNKYIDDYIVVEVAHNTEDATASASDILSGQTAYISDGSKATGTMTNNGAISQTITTPTGSYTIPVGYHNGSGTVSANIPVYDYSYLLLFPGLCFTANTTGSTITMSVNGTPTLGQNFQTSTDGHTWSDFTPGTTTITLANVGDKVYFKGNNPNGINQSDEIGYRFVMTGSIAASGNIMSLIDNGICTSMTIPNQFCFMYLFSNCISLTSAPKLPATQLTIGCYYEMFRGCTSLTTPPELPATTLQEQCYYSMFRSCTSLVKVPKLSATTLVDRCYYSMFRTCSNLVISDTQTSEAVQSWSIPTTSTFTNTLTQGSMFNECKGTRSSSNLEAEAGQSYTYYTQNAPV